jgi:hypothetical protein
MSSRSDAARRPATGWWGVFWSVAAFYDMALGLLFFFLYGPIFAKLGLTLPNNTSYISLTAAFVFVQGAGYYLVQRDPLNSTNIVRLGLLYKAIYIAVAVWYLIIGQLQGSIFAWFAAFDAVFLIFFALYLRRSPS